MKSDCIDNNDNNNKPKYPYLGEFKKNGYQFVVLFTEPRNGVVVNVTKSEYHVGCSKNSWSEELFTPYKGKIILVND